MIDSLVTGCIHPMHNSKICTAPKEEKRKEINKINAYSHTGIDKNDIMHLIEH